MDTPRRWQIASLATAVAGLGVGGALLGRPAVEAVAAIDLDERAPSAVRWRPDATITEPSRSPQIVDAVVVGPDGDLATGPAASATTADSTVTPSSVTSHVSVASPDEPAVRAPSSPAPSSPAPRTDQSADSPESVDSPDSLDS